MHSHSSSTTGGAAGTSPTAPGTNSAGTALSSSGTGGATKGVALGTGDAEFPELAQLLRRRGVTDGDAYVADMREVFRRMFNILIDNTDDHEKNHALLMTDAQQYELSPAFDILALGSGAGLSAVPSGRARGRLDRREQRDPRLTGSFAVSLNDL